MHANNQKRVLRSVFLFAGFAILAACSTPISVVKRRYEPGYHVQWSKSKEGQVIVREHTDQSYLLALVDSANSMESVPAEMGCYHATTNNWEDTFTESIPIQKEQIEVLPKATHTEANIPDSLTRQSESIDIQQKNIANLLGFSSAFFGLSGTVAWFLALYTSFVNSAGFSNGHAQLLLFLFSFLFTALGLTLSILSKMVAKHLPKDYSGLSILGRIGRIISIINFSLMALFILVVLLIFVLILLFFNNINIAI